MKMRLFIQTYTPANTQRKEELDHCLEFNKSILEVITVDRSDRITFKEWFNIINEHAEEGDISILGNSDIKFDQTIELANDIKDDECFCITRWDNGVMHNTGADVWIFRSKIKEVSDCDFGLGIADCDYAIAERLNRSGYFLSNPSKEIVTTHFHKSAFRTYYQMSKIPKPHITHVPQLLLSERRGLVSVFTSFSDSHADYYDNYLKPSLPKGTNVFIKKVTQHCQSGIYLSDGWLNQMTEKLDFMIEMVENNEIFIYLDVDVKVRSEYAFSTMIEELGDHDMAFQKDKNIACAGVFIGRRNPQTIKLFKMAREVIGKYGCDQPAINACLKESGVKWKFLSKKFWNFSFFAPFEWDGGLRFQIPNDVVLVHANWCKGEELKRKILDMA